MSAHRQKIAELETEIEALTRTAERCTEIMRGAKAAMAIAMVMLVLPITGLIDLPDAMVIGSIPLGLGSLVVLGSNDATRKELLETIKACERQRDDLINELPLASVAPH
jgi:hypothetical protein